MITTCFFDLGNVLVSFSHEKMWSQLSTVCHLPQKDLKELSCSLWEQYESGVISIHDILSHAQSFCPVTIHPPEFILAASDIFTIKPEMISLLQKLKSLSLQLILISNTCDIHYDFLKNRYSFFDLFDHLILSYQVGISKPSPRIFEYALKQANLTCKPHHAFFIDDIKQHVLAAQNLGIQGHLFTDIAPLIEEFARLGIKL